MFDASASSDPEGTALAYAWDLDGDGAFDDGAGATASRSFAAAGRATVRLRVEDARKGVGTVERAVDVRAGGTGPERIAPAPKVKVAAKPTGNGAKVRRFSVKAPRGTTVRVSCTGTSCPAVKTFEGTGTAKRLRRFERRFRAGTKLVVRVTQPGLVGAHVKVKIRSDRRAPARTESCLWPGRRKPRGCPAG